LLKPIVDTLELRSSTRFPLNPNTWHEFWAELDSEDIEVMILSKQFMEDCIESETYLVAMDGVLRYQAEKFDFTAQFDVHGFGLYLYDMKQVSDAEKQLTTFLNRSLNQSSSSG